MEIYTVKVYANGDRYWYQNGQRHRLDGPAFELANGDRFWFQNDKWHRLDGPAVEMADGYRAWYIDGVQLTEKEFCVKMKTRDACEGKTVTIDSITYKLVKE